MTSSMNEKYRYVKIQVFPNFRGGMYINVTLIDSEGILYHIGTHLSNSALKNPLTSTFWKF